MDTSSVPTQANPREKANIIAVLFWTWTWKFFKTGYSKVVEPGDLYEPLKSDRSNVLGDRLEIEWMKQLERCEKSNKSPSLLKAILCCFLRENLLMGLQHFINEFILRLGIPMLIGRLLHYFKDDADEAFNMAIIYATGICVATMINAISISQLLFREYYTGGKMRIAVCSIVYRKALRLSSTALGDTSPGKIVNLIANDVNKFDMILLYTHHMWSAPLLAVIIGYFLYVEIGYAAIFGFAVIFIVVSILAYTSKLSSKFRRETALKTDERIHLMDEIISGIQVIKMYAWEKSFCAMVKLARKLELRTIRKSAWIRAILMTSYLFTARMAIYCTLVSMLFFGQPLSTEKIFIFSSYFTMLAHTMSTMFVRGLSEIAECIVAVHRLQNFLLYNEVKSLKIIEDCSVSLEKIENECAIKSDSFVAKKNIRESFETKPNGLALVTKILEESNSNQALNQEPKPSDVAISLKHLTVKWEPSRLTNILEDINTDIEKGQLYMVIGAVGTGKSSLISAILGEMTIVNGQIDIQGSISYASQNAWIFGSSVRQNILFGQPYDHQRYQRVVEVCALQSDFRQFPEGDQMVVGERGCSLSGGQKVRINLARSVYRQADIYIFDDPLSAVDTHVGNHLFEDCIQNFLLGRTRILVTHQLQFIQYASAIILLEHGKLKRFANCAELLSERTEYMDPFISHCSPKETENVLPQITGMEEWLSSGSDKCHILDTSKNGYDTKTINKLTATKNNLEETSEGVVKGSIYVAYLRAGGSWCFIFIVAICFCMTQLMITINDMFYPMMVNIEEKRHDEWLSELETGNAGNTTDRDYWIEPSYPYIYVYTVIVLLTFVIGIVRSFLFYSLTLGASQCLHDRAFSALIHTEMLFFNTNFSGRILNRFSKDVGASDELLPRAIFDAAQDILMMFGALLIVCIINPIFVAPLLLISFIFYWIRKVYIKTSRTVKRLEGIMKAPVFTQLNTTLDGLFTIRAYNVQETLRIEFDRLQDNHSSAWYMFLVTSMAFAFSLDLFTSIFTTIVTLTLLFIRNYSGWQVGLAITTIISLTERIQWGMRQSAQAVNQMTSVERIFEYTLLLPEENLTHEHIIKENNKYLRKKESVATLEEAPVRTLKSWPGLGGIMFKRVYLRYAKDDPAVLKDLNMVIKPGEKVGIVGRTGAGKSSLIAALFRLAKVDGVIEIDGVNTEEICLKDLRKNISIIPQDPVLFSGPLRKNLDPFNEFTNDALWSALDDVELKDAVINGSNGLESTVLDKGTNYSIGQRQLICLARAILRNNKILVLDEATANVDVCTDALIQKTIRTKFAQCTVLTVAHRLNTIMDSNKVLVMDKGHLVEYDHPYVLLQNQHGKFTSLVEETGPAMWDELFKVAKVSYEGKYRKQL